MGFLKKLGGHLKGAAIEGLRTAGANAVQSILYPKRLTDNEIIKKINDINGMNFTYLSNNVKHIGSDFNHAEIPLMTYRKDIESNTKRNIVSSENDDIFKLRIPDWGVDDFINEQMMFKKSISTISNDPGWFYFKIFFEFDTQQGLFGGLLNNNKITSSVNSAGLFLAQSANLYKYHKLNERLDALKKFASILSFISSSAPWFFNKVKGLDQAGLPQLDDIERTKSIEIECSQDAIDMRLTTLLGLYKFAAFDDINYKEIIPENLRKFNMSIVVFSAPIMKYHSAIKSRSLNTIIKSKTLYDYNNFLSYKIFNFINCEFDKSTLAGSVPSEISNETPFQLGKNSIKINYDRVYEHTANEFNKIIFGSAGYYYNQVSSIINDVDSAEVEVNKIQDVLNQNQRYIALQNALENTYKMPYNHVMHKELIDLSEELSQSIFSSNRSTLQKVAGNYLLKLLHTSWRVSNGLGNLYSNVGPGSQYDRDKKKGRKGPGTAVGFHDLKDKITKFDFTNFLHDSFAKL